MVSGDGPRYTKEVLGEKTAFKILTLVGTPVLAPDISKSKPPWKIPLQGY